VQLINVAYDMTTTGTREREIKGLSMAMKELKVSEGIIISMTTHSETIEIEGKKIL
jgi:hypothetical protein